MSSVTSNQGNVSSFIKGERSESGWDLNSIKAIESMLCVRMSEGMLDLTRTATVMPSSDLECAKMIEEFFDRKLRYSEGSQKWRTWNEPIWDEVSRDSLRRIFGEFANVYKEVLKEIKEFCRADDSNSSEKQNRFKRDFSEHQKYLTRLLSNSGQRALEAQLQWQCGFAEERYDTNTTIVVVRNGVLDTSMIKELGEVKLLDHSPERPVTAYAPVAYRPETKSKHWEYLLQTSLEDEETRKYLQRFLGAALLRKPVEKGFLNLKGEMNSGKSVILDVISEMFGPYYTVSLSPKVFTRSHSNSFDKHLIRGKMFVLTSETGEGERIDDSFVKQLTGSDKQTTAPKYRDPVTWMPQCTILIASNNALRFETSDKAMASRYKIINFPKSFSLEADAPEELRAVKGLKEKILAELDGVFNWFVEGLVEYVRYGLGNEPSSVQESRQKMICEINTGEEWLQSALNNHVIQEVDPDDFTVFKKSLRLTPSEIYQEYENWCRENGYDKALKLDGQKLGKTLSSHYPIKSKTAGIRYLQLVRGEMWTQSDTTIKKYVDREPTGY